MGDLTLRTTDEFIFADAFIGCHESKLMKWQDLVRLANCIDLTGAETVLQEFDYEDFKRLQEGDIEGFIREERTNLYDMIFHNLPGREEMASFLYPYDYHNIKVCIKSEIMGKTPGEHQLISTSDMDWKSIVAMVRDRNFAAMKPSMSAAVQDALEAYGRSNDPQEVDLVLDKACYKDMASCARETGSEFLVNMVKMQVDVLNLKTFARLKIMGKPWTFFKKVFLEEGSITEEFFASCYDDPLTQVAEKLIDQRLRDAVAEGGRDLEETGTFTLYEKLLDNVLMDENRKAKDYIEGIEPVAGFWYAKEQELRNVRIILNGIHNEATPEDMIKFLIKPYLE